jgi:hypothetical protein
MSRGKRLGFAVATVLLLPLLLGHLNSPHVFLEEDLGEYPAAITAHMPTAIPGEAELRLRLLDLRSDENVEVRIREWPPQGEAYAPVWTEAESSKVDSRFFTAPIPLMEHGVWQVEVEVTGDRQGGKTRFPISARIAKPRTMDSRLGGTLIGLFVLLFVTLWQMLSALGREVHLAPGRDQDQKKFRGLLWAAIGWLSLGLFLAFTIFSWQNFNDKNIRLSGSPYKTEINLAGEGARVGRPAHFEFIMTDRKGNPPEDLERDGEIWMHLLLVDRDGATTFTHLHPTMSRMGQFSWSFVPQREGVFEAYAELRRNGGESVTIPFEFNVEAGDPAAMPTALSLPDTSSMQPAFGTLQVGRREADLGDGYRLRFVEPGGTTLSAGDFLHFRFEVQGPAGEVVPVEQSYDGNFARIWILKDDFETFATLVPGGTLAGRNDRTAETGDLRLPYGFPSPGLYRVWLQLTVDDVVRTGVFDMLAN